jgi:UDP-N-acetyl-D-galactosamine dehydrogenase
MLKRGIPVLKSRILIMGLTFKADCPDLRNSKVIDIITTLQDYHVDIDVHDPWVSPDASHKEYGFEVMVDMPQSNAYDAVILAVDHRNFIAMGVDALRGFCKEGGIFYDVKGAFEKELSDERL